MMMFPSDELAKCCGGEHCVEGCAQMHGHQINEFLEHEAGAAQNGSAHSLPEVGVHSRSAGTAAADIRPAWLCACNHHIRVSCMQNPCQAGKPGRILRTGSK